MDRILPQICTASAYGNIKLVIKQYRFAVLYGTLSSLNLFGVTRWFKVPGKDNIVYIYCTRFISSRTSQSGLGFFLSRLILNIHITPINPSTWLVKYPSNFQRNPTLYDLYSTGRCGIQYIFWGTIWTFKHEPSRP